MRLAFTKEKGKNERTTAVDSTSWTLYKTNACFPTFFVRDTRLFSILGYDSHGMEEVFSALWCKSDYLVFLDGRKSLFGNFYRPSRNPFVAFTPSCPISIAPSLMYRHALFAYLSNLSINYSNFEVNKPRRQYLCLVWIIQTIQSRMMCFFDIFYLIWD